MRRGGNVTGALQDEIAADIKEKIAAHFESRERILKDVPEHLIKGSNCSVKFLDEHPHFIPEVSFLQSEYGWQYRAMTEAWETLRKEPSVGALPPIESKLVRHFMFHLCERGLNSAERFVAVWEDVKALEPRTSSVNAVDAENIERIARKFEFILRNTILSPTVIRDKLPSSTLGNSDPRNAKRVIYVDAVTSINRDLYSQYDSQNRNIAAIIEGLDVPGQKVIRQATSSVLNVLSVPEVVMPVKQAPVAVKIDGERNGHNGNNDSVESSIGENSIGLSREEIDFQAIEPVFAQTKTEETQVETQSSFHPASFFKRIFVDTPIQLIVEKPVVRRVWGVIRGLVNLVNL